MKTIQRLTKIAKCSASENKTTHVAHYRCRFLAHFAYSVSTIVHHLSS